MKKTLCVFIVFFFFSFMVSAQIAYYGALNIRENCTIQGSNSFKFKTDSASLSKLSSYLKAFLPNEMKNDTSLTTDQVFTQYAGNPFLGTKAARLVGGSSLSIAGLSSDVISSIGNLDVTNVADGLAKFIVERTKQELSVAFFERFKQDLDSIKQIQILFPATFSALQAIDQEIYNYSAYLNLIRESFQKDLVFLLPNIEKLVNDSCMNILFDKYPEIRTMLSSAVYIAWEFSEGKHPGDIIHDYLYLHANENSLNEIDPNLYPSLQTLDMFSQSLRSKQNGRYWVTTDSLKLLFEDNTTFIIYLGLIYQQAQNEAIRFNDKNLTDIMFEWKDTTLYYKNYISGLMSKCKQADYYFTTIKQKINTGDDKPTYQDYYSFYDATLNIAESVFENPWTSQLFPNTNMVNDFFKSARSLGNIYVDIYEKQYTSAVVEFGSIYSCLTDKRITALINQINNQIKNEDNNAIKEKLKAKRLRLERMQKVGPLILKYGSFAANVANAENSDEVQEAIEAIALPAGSSCVKRETAFNVSLNAYCGLTLPGYNFNAGSNYFSWGMTAPVGIATSWGGRKFLCLPRHREGHFSHSIFLSIIDIGAITAFRFKNDSVVSVQKIQLKDIISPGVFYTLGIPKTPVSINVGYQITPLLNTVTPEENTFLPGTSRISFSICVDLPVLNLYTKPKNATW